MILDAEKAVIDYLTTNMATLVGNGNYTVPLYRQSFPDDGAAYALSVFAELPGVHESVPQLMPIGVRILVRSIDLEAAFTLTQNLDTILDKLVVHNFNSEVECCLSNRNSGPDRIYGANNALYYYQVMYSMILRAR